MANEKKFVTLSRRLRECLSRKRADVERGIEILNDYQTITLQPLMLLRNPLYVDVILRLRCYIGNLREWNYSEEQERIFKEKAEIIRRLSVDLYDKFKQILPLLGMENYWEKYLYHYELYKHNTRHLSATMRLNISDAQYNRLLLDKIELNKTRRDDGDDDDTDVEEIKLHLDLVGIQNQEEEDDDDDLNDVNPAAPRNIWSQSTKPARGSSSAIYTSEKDDDVDVDDSDVDVDDSDVDVDDSDVDVDDSDVDVDDSDVDVGDADVDVDLADVDVDVTDEINAEESDFNDSNVERTTDENKYEENEVNIKEDKENNNNTDDSTNAQNSNNEAEVEEIAEVTIYIQAKFRYYM